MCEAYNLRAVDVTSAAQEVVVDGCFSGAAYDPQKKEGLLSVTEFNQEYCSCGRSLEPGTYIFGEGFPFKKFEYILAYSIGFIQRNSSSPSTPIRACNIFTRMGYPFPCRPMSKA